MPSKDSRQIEIQFDNVFPKAKSKFSGYLLKKKIKHNSSPERSSPRTNFCLRKLQLKR